MLTFPILTTIIVDAVALMVGLFAYLSNTKRKANRLVLALTLVSAASLAAQNIGEFADPARVTLWARTDSGLSIIGDALLLWLTCTFPRQLISRRAEIIFGWISFGFVLLSITPVMIVAGVSQHGQVALTTGPLMPLYYAVDAAYTLLILPALYQQYRRGGKIDRLRIKYLLVYGGMVAIAISVLGLWLPIYFHLYQAVDYVPFIALLGLLLVTYDILALRLLSIRLVVARSVAYLLLLVSFAAAYYVLAMFLGQLAFGTPDESALDQAYQIAVALGLTFLFQPVRRWFERLTNSWFYHDHYDQPAVIMEFSQILATEISLDALLRQSLECVCSNLHLKWGEIVVFDGPQVFASARYNHRGLSRAALTALRQLPQPVLVAEELADDDPERPKLAANDVQLAVQLVTQGRPVGLMLFGDKLSGDVYTNQDVGTLDIMRQELGVAIQNARAYRQLEDTEAQLAATDELKSEFVALSSHNLRTPIASIQLISDLLEHSKRPSDIAKYVGMLTDVSGQLSDFVEELLTISTLEAGNQPAGFERMAIDELIRPLVETARQQALAKGLALQLELPFEQVMVRANADHLRIVIKNLLSNAVKFTGNGQIVVSLAVRGHDCLLKVVDTGVGISGAELKHLFTKFHRGTSYIHYNYAGAGVGLYLAKLVIAEHGGDIAVDSRVDSGTVVTVRLPLAIR